jgi:hypothetical protein
VTAADSYVVEQRSADRLFVGVLMILAVSLKIPRCWKKTCTITNVGEMPRALVLANLFNINLFDI